LKIDNDTADAYIAWLKRHIPEMLQVEGFETAKIFTRNPKDENAEADEKRKWFCVQYIVRKREDVDNYLQHHAAGFRAEGIKLFGGKFEAARRILVVSDEFKK